MISLLLDKAGPRRIGNVVYLHFFFSPEFGRQVVP